MTNENENNKDIDLNKVPYQIGNRVIYCSYSQEKCRYVMHKPRSIWKTISDWWNRK